MGIIHVTLEDEEGNEIVSIADSNGVMSRAMAEGDDARFPWAGTIDPYGDTTFNRKQAELLRKEWGLLILQAADQRTEALLGGLTTFLSDAFLECIST